MRNMFLIFLLVFPVTYHPASANKKNKNNYGSNIDKAITKSLRLSSTEKRDLALFLSVLSSYQSRVEYQLQQKTAWSDYVRLFSSFSSYADSADSSNYGKGILTDCPGKSKPLSCKHLILNFDAKRQRFSEGFAGISEKFLGESLGNRGMELKYYFNSDSRFAAVENISRVNGLSLDLKDFINFLKGKFLHLVKNGCLTKEGKNSEIHINKEPCHAISKKSDSNFHAFLRKYFTFYTFANLEKSFSLKFKLDQKALRRDFPQAFKKSAYTLKNLRFQLLLLDEKKQHLAKISYIPQQRRWHIYADKRNFLTRSKGNSVQRYTVVASGMVNIYGLKLSWQDLHLSLRYKQAKGRYNLLLTWAKTPQFQLAGRLYTIVPQWLLNLFTRGKNLEERISDLFYRLAGAGEPKRAWRWELFSYPNPFSPKSNILSIRSNMLVASSGNLLPYYAERRRFNDIPSFFSTLWLCLAEDLRKVAN